MWYWQTETWLRIQLRYLRLIAETHPRPQLWIQRPRLTCANLPNKGFKRKPTPKLNYADKQAFLKLSEKRAKSWTSTKANAFSSRSKKTHTNKSTKKPLTNWIELRKSSNLLSSHNDTIFQSISINLILITSILFNCFVFYSNLSNSFWWF